MAPPADQLDQAFINEQGRFDASLRLEMVNHFYAIAYCSGDGEINSGTFTGKPSERLEYMQSLMAADPADNRDWIVATYDDLARRWKRPFLSGKGELETELEQHLHQFISSMKTS